jgi:hypothetical protein
LLVLGGGFIPAAHAFFSSAIVNPQRICLISLNGNFRRFRSDTLFDLASAWSSSKYLESVAPYSWAPGWLAGDQRTVPALAARVAPGFFPLLGVPAVLGRTLNEEDNQHCPSCVVLSHAAWKLQFGGDPRIVGRAIELNGKDRIVAGVLPRNFQLVLPDIAVWGLLDSSAPPFSNFSGRIGAVARMKPGATEAKVQSNVNDLSENAGYIMPTSLLVVTSVHRAKQQTVESYLSFLLLAITCSVWIVYMRRPNGTLAAAPASLRECSRRWSFFILKVVLLLFITCLLAWKAVSWSSILLVGTIYPMVEGLVLWLFIILSVAPLSWAIRDQRKRCRVCLRRPGYPVRIGPPGNVLLNWSGTEMMCTEGHGVLYLADSEANCLDRDRWDALDPSWAQLFAGTPPPEPPDQGRTHSR